MREAFAPRDVNDHEVENTGGCDALDQPRRRRHGRHLAECHCNDTMVQWDNPSRPKYLIDTPQRRNNTFGTLRQDAYPIRMLTV